MAFVIAYPPQKSDTLSLAMTLRTLFAVLLLAAMPSIAADSDFNGRWDLTTLTQPRPRAWWVELTGVGDRKSIV